MTRTNTLVTEEFPLMNLMANQRDEILTGTQTQDFERKDRMSTQVVDETTLRIYFSKASNADPFTQSKSTTVSLAPENSDIATELKDKPEDINIQGQTCYCSFLALLSSRQKFFFYTKRYIGEL